MAAFENDVDRELLEIFKPAAHREPDGINDPRAIIIRRGDAGLGVGKAGSREHGGGDFFRRAKRNAGDGRTGTAEESAESAGLFCGSDDAIEKRNELFSKRLVQMIDEGAAQILVMALANAAVMSAGIAAGFDRVQAIDLVRQNAARFRRLDLELRDEKNEMEPRSSVNFWCRLFRATTKPPNSAGAALSG